MSELEEKSVSENDVEASQKFKVLWQYVCML